MKKAWVIQGGWEGHEPQLVSKRFAGILEKHGFDVKIFDTLDCLADKDALMQIDLLVPCWTMGTIPFSYTQNVAAAVGAGVGMAGCHGGMCDSFRNDVWWQFITGGQFIDHPGGGDAVYTVNICHSSSPIVEGLEDFEVNSEQYYMHYDPAVEILATTRFPTIPFYHISNKPVDMPVAWTKFWGNGRVFYTSLGHVDEIFDKYPTAQTMMERGMLWAAEGKQYAIDHNLTTDRFMYIKPENN